MDKFTFSSALMHFRNTSGPGSFLWKWLLSAIIVFTALFSLTILLVFDMISTVGVIEVNTRVPISQAQAAAIMGKMFGYFAIAVPLGAMAMAALEASALRRYIRNEGFSLKFGKDEMRMIGIYLCWVGLMIIANLVSLVAVFVLGLIGMAIISFAPWSQFIVSLLLALPTYALFIFLLVRFAPASSVTIRDNKVTFLSIDSVTAGRFWTILGAFAVVMVAGLLINLALQAVFMMPMFLSLSTSSDAVFTPALIAAAIVYGLATAIVSAVLIYINLGISSRAALTDPEWTGHSEAVAEMFD